MWRGCGDVTDGAQKGHGSELDGIQRGLGDREGLGMGGHGGDINGTCRGHRDDMELTWG